MDATLKFRLIMTGIFVFIWALIALFIVLEKHWNKKQKVLNIIVVTLPCLIMLFLLYSIPVQTTADDKKTTTNNNEKPIIENEEIRVQKDLSTGRIYTVSKINEKSQEEIDKCTVKPETYSCIGNYENGDNKTIVIVACGDYTPYYSISFSTDYDAFKKKMRTEIQESDVNTISDEEFIKSLCNGYSPYNCEVSKYKNKLYIGIVQYNLEKQDRSWEEVLKEEAMNENFYQGYCIKQNGEKFYTKD